MNDLWYFWIKKNCAIQQEPKHLVKFQIQINWSILKINPSKNSSCLYSGWPVTNDGKQLQDRWGGLETDHGSDSNLTLHGHLEPNVVQTILHCHLQSEAFLCVHVRHHFLKPLTIKTFRNKSYLVTGFCWSYFDHLLFRSTKRRERRQNIRLVLRKKLEHIFLTHKVCPLVLRDVHYNMKPGWCTNNILPRH